MMRHGRSGMYGEERFGVERLSFSGAQSQPQSASLPCSSTGNHRPFGRLRISITGFGLDRMLAGGFVDNMGILQGFRELNLVKCNVPSQCFDAVSPFEHRPPSSSDVPRHLISPGFRCCLIAHSSLYL